MPEGSGYNLKIEQIEQENKNPMDKSANEMKALGPHFLDLVEDSNFEVSEEQREQLRLELLNGNPKAIIKVAEFLIKKYLAGKDIEEVKIRYLRNFGKPQKYQVYPKELEAILADQLINNLTRKMEQDNQQLGLRVSVPENIAESIKDIDLNP